MIWWLQFRLVHIRSAKALTLVVKVNSSRTTDLSNTASVSSSTPDATPGNNSATEATVVNTSANLSITKSDSHQKSTRLNYSHQIISYADVCSKKKLAVALSDPLPAGTSVVS